MARFTRPAPWIQDLFTPSRSQKDDPGIRSDDVSLIQPYDGSGWPLQPVGEWVTNKQLAAATDKSVPFSTLRDDQVSRIIALSCDLLAGANATAFFFIEGPANLGVGCSSRVTTVDGELNAFEIYSPIIPPGHRLTGRYFGGDVLTVINFHAALCTVPLGTVFYV